ncbi:peptide ligase PGM1-related protein [Streptomyces sp. NPDC050610]|uniref:preATP grasp domain-containing protein n=1 Tax=Streptomyces sp. NPDC050610 TaxID=3157097 RepID=UPI003433D526
MSRLLIGNDFTEDLEDAGEQRLATVRWHAKRALFFARDHDVLVLPEAPDDSFVRYVTALTGTDPASLAVVTSPGSAALTSATLADPALHERVRAALTGRRVDEVIPLHPDPAAVELARGLGLLDAVAGHAFIAQGGGSLANSKAVFRALAAGTGTPIPDGTVCADVETAARAVYVLFEREHPVIVKHEYRQATRGNEILSPFGGITAWGAQHLTVLSDRRAVAAHLRDNWGRLTSGGRHRLVVERYFPDSTALFAEFKLTDTGTEPAGQGEMIYDPTPSAQIMPVRTVRPELTAELLARGRELCEPLRAMGYRGTVSTDAIVTPDGQLYFTEFNSRTTGSTHIYAEIGARIVGPDYPDRRVLLEHVAWPVTSFDQAVTALTEAGLAYSQDTRTGVVISTAFDTAHQDVCFCVVSEDLAEATKLRLRVLGLVDA